MAKNNHNHSFNSVNKRGRLKTIAGAVLLFLGGAVLSYFVPFNYFLGQLSTRGAQLRAGQQGLINPLLAAEIGDKKEFFEFKPLEEKLHRSIDDIVNGGRATEIGIYFRDLETGRWTGVNENALFAPASLLKVPLMIAYLKAAESDSGILEKQLLYDGSFDDNATEDIKPLKAIEKGKWYSVNELLVFMIGYSDNNATKLLFENIDNRALVEVFTDLAVSSPNSPNDYLSPKDYAYFFRVLYSATYLNKSMSEKALGLLADYQDFPQGLQSGVPPNVVVAQKFGEHSFTPGNVKELHDCGIVYHSQRPYFICVMTKGTDFTKLTGVISDISSLVYREVNSNYR